MQRKGKQTKTNWGWTQKAFGFGGKTVTLYFSVFVAVV